MKRLIALLLCLVMCVSVFVACGDDKPEDTQGGDTPSTTKPQGDDETTKPQDTDVTDPEDTGDDTTNPDDTGDDTTNPDDTGDDTTNPGPGNDNPEFDLDDILPEYPENEKLADEDIGAKDAGVVADGYVTVGKTPIASLDEITDPNGSYYLTADIDENTTTITEFNGVLDGCGYTITTTVPLFESLGGAVLNLNLEGEISFTGEPEAPLANAIVDGATVFNVMNSCDITVAESTTTDVYAGGFAIYVYGDEVVFANCEYAGTINNVYEAKSNNRYTGGFVGSIRKNVNDDESNDPYVDFLYCTFSGSIENTDHLGGIVGEVYNFVEVFFWGCLSDGALETTQGYAGGLLGYMQGEASAWLSMVNCANKTDVISENVAGGLAGGNTEAGDSNYMEFIWCTNDAEITAAARVAGIVGRIKGDSTFKNCVNLGNLVGTLGKDADGNPTTKGSTYMGGILGETTDGGQDKTATFENCVNYGNIDSRRSEVRVGGISGHHDFVPLVATNCVNFGDITSHYVPADNAPGSYRFGGITGGGKGNWQEFYNCVNFGDITVNHAGEIQPAGGIVGYSAGTRTSLIMENCMNYGNIDNSATPVTNADGATAKGSVLGGLAGFCLSHTEEFKVTGCINGGTLNSSVAVADLIAWRQNPGDASFSQSVVTMSNVYYLSDAYTGDVVHGPFLWGIDGKDPSVRTGDALVAEAVRESEIEDGSDIGLAKKMNNVAGEELFACVKVNLNEIETKTCVVPTAILGLIAENIAQ